MRRLLGGCLALVLLLTALLGDHADALPIAPDPVAPVQGIPEPCPTTHPWPGDDVPLPQVTEQLTAHFGFQLAGSQWTEEHRESVRIIWETLDAVSCTDYVSVMRTKATVGLNAIPKRGYAWGDWSLTRTNYVTLDFAKFQRALDAGDEGRLVRLVIHELAHAWSTDRHANPDYWQDFRALAAREGRFSDYAGSKTSEVFADVVGYYVGRCALDNPYDSGEHAAYYEFARDVVFNGKEFGPAPGTVPDCELPAPNAEVPMPGDEATSSWIVEVSES